MPFWKAKKLGNLTQEKVLLELYRRLANSRRPLSDQRAPCPPPLSTPPQSLHSARVVLADAPSVLCREAVVL